MNEIELAGFSMKAVALTIYLSHFCHKGYGKSRE
jgi:hypothetical protein